MGAPNFAGSVPALYDRYLAPLLFQPYANETARRARLLNPSNLLEVAAGTGIVTRALAAALPNAKIVATDLNQAMLDIAAAYPLSGNVSFRAADALDLPFADESFDLVVSQFGVMFYPDRVRGNREARRVLRNGGHYLAVIWGALDDNPASQIVHEAVSALYPADPPTFLARAPFGYSDTGAIENDLRAAGFDAIQIETVALESEPVSARDAAIGLVTGSPLAAEIEERDPNGLDACVEAAARALRAVEKEGRLESRLSAHIVTATK